MKTHILTLTTPDDTNVQDIANMLSQHLNSQSQSQMTLNYVGRAAISFSSITDREGVLNRQEGKTFPGNWGFDVSECEKRTMEEILEYVRYYNPGALKDPKVQEWKALLSTNPDQASEFYEEHQLFEITGFHWDLETTEMEDEAVELEGQPKIINFSSPDACPAGEMQSIGDLNFPSGKVLVTDPCYIKGTPKSWLTTTLDLPSECEGLIWKSDLGAWGERVTGLAVVAKNHGNVSVDEEPIGRAGLDAGMVMMIDHAASVNEWKDEDDFRLERIYQHKGTGARLEYEKHFGNYDDPIASQGGKSMKELNATGEWEHIEQHAGDELTYGNACILTLGAKGYGTVGAGRAVVASSGLGDGMYGVHALRNDAGDVVGAVAIFIAEADLDGYDDKDDEEPENDIAGTPEQETLNA